MQLAISNIAWGNDSDDTMYAHLKEIGWALEVAPTRIINDAPYDNKEQAINYARNIGLSILSMQSIWFGRKENIFSSSNDRKALIEYTKKAVDFANAIGCRNLVFGSPRNRDVEHTNEIDNIAKDFFRRIGDYAAENNTVIALEANPPIYNTRFLNTTEEAAEMAAQVNNAGIGINLDIGTMINNGENPRIIPDILPLISHVHISEPFLKPIEKREIHLQILSLLKANKYAHAVSIEMANPDNIEIVKQAIKYVRDLNQTL